MKKYTKLIYMYKAENEKKEKRNMFVETGLKCINFHYKKSNPPLFHKCCKHRRVCQNSRNLIPPKVKLGGCFSTIYSAFTHLTSVNLTSCVPFDLLVGNSGNFFYACCTRAVSYSKVSKGAKIRKPCFLQ